MNTKEIGAALALLKGKAIEQVPAAVKEWLDDHPEATTTVEDGSITKAKLYEDLAEEIEGNTADVTQLKNALQETAQESTGQELLAVLVAETLVTESLLGVAGNIIDHLPQDESGTDIRDALALEADRLSAIYDLWYAEKEGA